MVDNEFIVGDPVHVVSRPKLIGKVVEIVNADIVLVEFRDVPGTEPVTVKSSRLEYHV